MKINNDKLFCSKHNFGRISALHLHLDIFHLNREQEKARRKKDEKVVLM